MQNEGSHIHMESEMSIVVEALVQAKEKHFEATCLNISLAQREQKELYDTCRIQMNCICTVFVISSLHVHVHVYAIRPGFMYL